jgi:hypothetical protein
MKYNSILLFLLCLFSATAHPGRRDAALPIGHYDLAEFVFRQYVSADSKVVFHLTYGTNDAPLAAEFMSRFKGRTPIVRSAPDGVMVVSNKIVLDKLTHQEAVGLGIREIRVNEDTAEVQVVYFASYTSNSTRFYLVREGGKWRVRERKVEWIACG